MTQGFEIRSHTVEVYDFNPFSSGAKNPQDQVLKVTVAGVPLSVQDSEIINMLNKFNVVIKSELLYEKIRNPVTKKMTSVLNGNRFVYIAPLSMGSFLPRISYCAGLKCRIYHFGQPLNKPVVEC